MINNKEKMIRQQQEKTRTWLAKTLVKTLMGTILLIFIVIGAEMSLEVSEEDVEKKDLREIIVLIWTSETALIGATLKFYFGNKNSDKS